MQRRSMLSLLISCLNDCSFRLGKTWVLIATDLLGRGIDFKGVNVVINYDMPQVLLNSGSLKNMDV